MDNIDLPDDAKITVCSECLRACCFAGVFYCDRSRDAGTKHLTVAQLRSLGREHPTHWPPAVVVD